MNVLTPLFGPIGPEILILIALIVVLFGANKIPEVARATGKSLAEFKKGQVEGKENTKVFPDVEPDSEGTSSGDTQTTSTNPTSNNSPPNRDTNGENTDHENSEVELGEETELSNKSGTAPVTSVDGISDTYQERLEANGITSVSDLADTNSSYVADAADTSLMDATNWTNEAQKMVDGEELEKENTE